MPQLPHETPAAEAARPREVPCAGAIIRDEAGRLLVVRRGRPPDVGRWSVPGGRCLTGESPADACVREVREETGLEVRVLRHAGRVRRPGVGDATYVIDDFVCAVAGGTLQAGDDAADARWVDASGLADLPLTAGLLDALTAWDLLPL